MNVQLKIRDHANELQNSKTRRNSSEADVPLDAKAKQHYTPCVRIMIPLFRHPNAALRVVVYVVLALNLGTLFTLISQDDGQHFNDRMTNIIILMVALSRS